MPRLALLNMLMGFSILSIVAAAGAFIATDLTEAYLNDPELIHSWEILLSKSSHGHTNLFGILHICFGLTLPYSQLSMKIKKLQTLFLFLGVVAMGPLMFLRGKVGPAENIDVLEILTGLCLSLALITLVSHAFGLARKYFSHA